MYSREQGEQVGSSSLAALEVKGAPKVNLKDLLNSAMVVVAITCLVIIFSLSSPYFLTSTNIYHILQQVAIVGILSIGQSFVIITAGIDMAQGPVIGLCGVITALLMTGGSSPIVASIGALSVGAVIGLVNGFLVTKAKIPPFIATLGTMSIATGAALVITRGQPVFGISNSFLVLGQNGLGIMPYSAGIMFLLAVVFHVVLSNMRFGRFTYAIGSNPQSARLSGIRVDNILIIVYLISGVLSAVGALIMTSWVDSALPTAGANYQLSSIAAVVIGGGSLFGGEGTVWGSIVGAFLMGVLADGSNLLGISTYWQSILLGIVIVLAVYIDGFRRRKSA